MALLSPRALPSVGVGELSNLSGTKLEWTRSALHKKKNLRSPLDTFMKVAKHAELLTPGSERLTGNSLRALLAPMPMSMLMDEEDAKQCLELVAEKVEKRAAKREAEALEASALQSWWNKASAARPSERP